MIYDLTAGLNGALLHSAATPAAVFDSSLADFYTALEKTKRLLQNYPFPDFHYL